MSEPAGLKFGFVTPADRARIASLEAMPIDSLWVGGHIASPNPTPEAMMQLAQLAAWTERVTVGTSILLLPLYPPAIIAKQVADLDRACGGRITLGVGVGGEYPQEFRACGVDIHERGARLNESIPLLRALWRAEPVNHHGRFFPMEDVLIHPAPTQGNRLPIIVAGRQRAAMVRAAHLGDGWLPYLYSADRYARSVDTIVDVARAAGRDLAEFEWMAFVFINVADDRELARAEAAAFLGGNYRQDFAAMLDRIAVAGTVHEVIAGVRRFIDAGARHIVFTPASRERSAEIARRICHEVIPELRSR
jgi:probable F420-dependent oxidoreductase